MPKWGSGLKMSRVRKGKTHNLQKQYKFAIYRSNVEDENNAKRQYTEILYYRKIVTRCDKARGNCDNDR